jgi:hypothetical protein
MTKASQNTVTALNQQIDGLHAQIEQLKAELLQKSVSAARWDAVMACGRIRVLGSAGLASDTDPYNKPYGHYGHLGLELWTKHEASTPPENILLFEKFADKAIAEQAAPKGPADETVKNGQKAITFLEQLKSIGGLHNLLALASQAYDEGYNTSVKVQQGTEKFSFEMGWGQSAAARITRLRASCITNSKQTIAGLDVDQTILPTLELIEEMQGELTQHSWEATCIGFIEQVFQEGFNNHSLQSKHPDLFGYALGLESSEAIQTIKNLLEECSPPEQVA